MKTHQIAFEQTGEYSTTPKTPSRVYVEGEINLTATKTCTLTSDDWRPCEELRWEVRKVSLPDWLSPEEWVKSWVAFKFLWGLGASKDWPESWQRGLIALPMAERYAAIALLGTKNFRSEFRKSLRDQIVAWCETAPESRKFKSPLSVRQWDAAIGPRGAQAAKRAGESLYHDNKYCGA